MKKGKILIIAIIIFSRVANSQTFSKDLIQLGSYIEGVFNSKEQALSDSNYFNIHLAMKRIWYDSKDGIWFYVEQASYEKIDKPYRQRVYRVSEVENGLFESKVFIIKNQSKYIGGWKDTLLLAGLSIEELTLREGCSVYLKKVSDYSFEGGTEGVGCESDLRSAKYASSEVKIEPDKFISWDRGFDENGNQVWGATKGPYIFKKEISYY